MGYPHRHSPERHRFSSLRRDGDALFRILSVEEMGKIEGREIPGRCVTRVTAPPTHEAATDPAEVSQCRNTQPNPILAFLHRESQRWSVRKEAWAMPPGAVSPWPDPGLPATLRQEASPDARQWSTRNTRQQAAKGSPAAGWAAERALKARTGQRAHQLHHPSRHSR